MADAYHGSGHNAITTTDRTLLELRASTNRRGRIFQAIFGTLTPSDNAVLYRLQRFTTNSTAGGTAVTPTALDPAAGASSCTMVSGTPNITGAPGYTANAYVGDFPGSVRNTLYWVAPTDKYMITLPATSGNGVGAVTSHGTVTPDCYATFYFEE